MKDQPRVDDASPFYTGIRDFGSASKRQEAKSRLHESSHSFKIVEGDDGEIEIQKQQKPGYEKYLLSSLQYFLKLR